MVNLKFDEKRVLLLGITIMYLYLNQMNLVPHARQTKDVAYQCPHVFRLIVTP
jgi:hypothetical protein